MNKSDISTVLLKNISFDKLSNLIKEIDEPEYRAKQVFEWLYRKRANSFDEMTNLAISLREKLKSFAIIKPPKLVKEQKSADGTIKYLLELNDGCQIETVLITEEKGITLCLSTQVGCKLSCTFCQTGKTGFIRNLSQEEILNQILFIKTANDIKENQRTNIVLMGMGEPLDNYDNVIKAVKIMISYEGMRMSPNRITLSTAGIVPNIERLSKEGININLAVSLNAVSDTVRTKLMPIARKYPYEDLIKACKRFHLPKRKTITIEYIMIDGVNDSKDDAFKLADVLRGVKCKINLIRLNPACSGDFAPSSMETIHLFQNILRSRKYTTMIRKSKGSDIMAACGQLGKNDKK